jgi:predicted transcriptional regulator
MTSIPTAKDVAVKLQPMTYAQISELSRRSSVPFHTLLKIRSGETSNPRIQTVSQFWAHIDAARAA